MAPFRSPKRTQGALPLAPAIANEQLEELRSLRNQVRCTWLRHEPLRIATDCSRALLPWGACDVPSAADCVPNAALLRSPHWLALR